MKTETETRAETFSPPLGVFPQLTFASEDDFSMVKAAGRVGRKPRSEMTVEDVLARWPALVAHVICASLGYATPTCAAHIVLDFAQGRENWCEWIYSCYDRKPGAAVKHAIRGRKGHKGYMADFKQALGLVVRAMVTGQEPEFAAWF